VGCFLVGVILALSPTAAIGSGAGKPGELIIRLEGGVLTLKARDVSHRRILEGLAKELNFDLALAGSLEDRRSLEINGRPWEEALKKALSPASWAFVYDSRGEEPRLAKVFVFPSTSDGSGPGRASPSPGRVAAPAPVRTPPPAAVSRAANFPN
jgi:hypothetical protein